MSGIFGGGGAPAPAQTQAQKNVSAAQSRAEERADAQKKTEMQGAMGRRRLQSSGGLRLLFSQARQEGPGDLPETRKLGGGS